MNARGSTEVIVATVGLSMGALNQNLFTMIVAMAVITTMAMPPTLRWALARLPMRKEEKQRLEREELEAKGFVCQRSSVCWSRSTTAPTAIRIAHRRHCRRLHAHADHRDAYPSKSAKKRRQEAASEAAQEKGQRSDARP